MNVSKANGMCNGLGKKKARTGDSLSGTESLGYILLQLTVVLNHILACSWAICDESQSKWL